jgi:thioesterase-3
MRSQIININYHRAATVGEELVIDTAMRDIGIKSASMRHVVKMKGTLKHLR